VYLLQPRDLVYLRSLLFSEHSQDLLGRQESQSEHTVPRCTIDHCAVGQLVQFSPTHNTTISTVLACRYFVSTRKRPLAQSFRPSLLYSTTGSERCCQLFHILTDLRWGLPLRVPETQEELRLHRRLWQLLRTGDSNNWFWSFIDSCIAWKTTITGMLMIMRTVSCHGNV